MLLKSRASPNMLPFSLCNKKRLAIRHTVYGWLSGRDQPTRQPPMHSEKYQCRMDTISSPDDRHIVARNM